MSALFHLPKATAFDADGIVIPGAKLSFFDAGTTTPQAVYSEYTLMTAITQPVVADSAGRFQPIFTATGSYKVVLTDAADVVIYTVDRVDSGLPAGTGVATVAQGGTNASTASGARTSLGAASQTDLDALSASLGALATRSTITRTQLAAGFGVVMLQGPVLVDSTVSLVTCTGNIPDDDTIPQVGEGTQVLSGNFTPLSASSVLMVAVQIGGAPGTAGVPGAALFTGASASAIAARAGPSPTTSRVSLDFVHRMASPGTNAIAFSVRAGIPSGSFFVNGETGGARRYGGVQKAQLIISEYLTI